MVMIRTLSKNGQIAIPKRILKSLGLVPPVKVRVSQTHGAVVIQPSPAQTLSDKEFLALLDRIRRRNRHITPRQLAEALKPMATFEDLRRHFAKVGITTRHWLLTLTNSA